MKQAPGGAGDPRTCCFDRRHNTAFMPPLCGGPTTHPSALFFGYAKKPNLNFPKSCIKVGQCPKTSFVIKRLMQMVFPGLLLVVSQAGQVCAIIEQPSSDQSLPDHDEICRLQKENGEHSNVISYLTSGALPDDRCATRMNVLESKQFQLIDGVLYHENLVFPVLLYLKSCVVLCWRSHIVVDL